MGRQRRAPLRVVRSPPVSVRVKTTRDTPASVRSDIRMPGKSNQMPHFVAEVFIYIAAFGLSDLLVDRVCSSEASGRARLMLVFMAVGCALLPAGRRTPDG